MKFLLLPSKLKQSITPLVYLLLEACCLGAFSALQAQERLQSIEPEVGVGLMTQTDLEDFHLTSIDEFSPLSLYPSRDSLQTSRVNPRRLRTLLIGGGVLYGATMAGLYQVWYQEGEQTSFHFFDDNAQWKQMDKVGHFYSAYHFSRAGAEAYRWAGLPEKRAMFWGAITGVILMTPIEIMDGFSSEYGASWGDFLANTSGSAFLYAQYALWNEVRIHPKFSFYRSGLASQRPAVLGEGLSEEILKDYNGQTYWLSFDIDRFLPEQSAYPKWLNLALGYGADNMLYARESENEALSDLDAYRQYYLGLDVDLTAIPARRKWAKVLIYLANMIRLPAPALEYNRVDGFRFHFLFF